MSLKNAKNKIPGEIEVWIELQTIRVHGQSEDCPNTEQPTGSTVEKKVSTFCWKNRFYFLFQGETESGTSAQSEDQKVETADAAAAADEADVSEVADVADEADQKKVKNNYFKFLFQICLLIIVCVCILFY